MSAIIIFQRMLILFAMVAIGYFCYKKSWLDDHSYGHLSKIVVNIMNPMLLISGVLNKDGGEGGLIFQDIIMMIIYFTVLIIFSYPMIKALRLDKNDGILYSLMLIFSNVGFMGIPVITSLYGAESTIYIVFYMLGYNVLLYTLGVVLVRKTSDEHKNEKLDLKSIMNPGVVACLVSIVIFAAKIRVPEFVESFASYMGNAVVPCSMILIGASTAKHSKSGLFGIKKLYLFTVIKGLIIPIAAALILKAFDFGLDDTVKGVFILTLAMPAGSIVPLLAHNNGADDSLCTKGVVVTTLAAVVTVPLVALFI